MFTLQLDQTVIAVAGAGLTWFFTYEIFSM